MTLMTLSIISLALAFVIFTPALLFMGDSVVDSNVWCCHLLTAAIQLVVSILFTVIALYWDTKGLRVTLIILYSIPLLIPLLLWGIFLSHWAQSFYWRNFTPEGRSFTKGFFKRDLYERNK